MTWNSLPDGAADPSIAWNRETEEWWLLYTQRRATVDDRAFLLYHVHQSLGSDEHETDDERSRRTVVQAAELRLDGDRLACDRDAYREE